MSNYSKRNDKMLAWIGLSLVLVILGAFVLKGIMPWVIYLGIIFVLLAIYAEREAEKKAVCDRSDYYGQYEEPDEMIRTQVSITKGELEIIETMEPLHDGSIEGAITNGVMKQVMQRVNCKKCNNEVYQICMCNPVKNERKTTDGLE